MLGGTEQVDDPVRVVGLSTHHPVTGQDELLVGEHSAQPIEVGAQLGVLGRTTIDQSQMRERWTLSVLGTPPHGAVELVSRAQAEFVNDLCADVDVLLAGRITRVTATDEPGAAAQDIQNTEGLTRLTPLMLIRLTLMLLSTLMLLLILPLRAILSLRAILPLRAILSLRAILPLSAILLMGLQLILLSLGVEPIDGYVTVHCSGFP